MVKYYAYVEVIKTLISLTFNRHSAVYVYCSCTLILSQNIIQMLSVIYYTYNFIKTLIYDYNGKNVKYKVKCLNRYFVKRYSRNYQTILIDFCQF